MTDEEPPFHYYGGPAHGELVSFHPNEPPGRSSMLPAQISDEIRWPGGYYEVDQAGYRYVWREGQAP